MAMFLNKMSKVDNSAGTIYNNSLPATKAHVTRYTRPSPTKGNPFPCHVELLLQHAVSSAWNERQWHTVQTVCSKETEKRF